MSDSYFESLRSPLVTHWDELSVFSDRTSLATYAGEELGRYLPDIVHGNTTLAGTIYRARNIDLKGGYDRPGPSDLFKCTFLDEGGDAVTVRLFASVNKSDEANMGLRVQYAHRELATLSHEFSPNPYPFYHSAHKRTDGVDDFGITLTRNTPGIMNELTITHNDAVQRGIYSFDGSAEALGHPRNSYDPSLLTEYWTMWSRFFFQDSIPMLQAHIGNKEEKGFVADENHMQEFKDWLRQTQLEKNIPGRIELDLKDGVVKHSVRSPNNRSIMFTDVLPQSVAVAYPDTAPALPRLLSRT
ncbi:MAG: hypothetical protein WCO78_00240 [Candidatus Roizmanbacteria bacterium]